MSALWLLMLFALLGVAQGNRVDISGMDDLQLDGYIGDTQNGATDTLAPKRTIDIAQEDKSEWTSETVKAKMKQTVKDLITKYEVFLFDCDGTLYHADGAISFVNQAIELLKRLGKKLFFVTNTSSRSAEQLQEKLAKIGVKAKVNECVPSGVFTAEYISKMTDELTTSKPEGKQPGVAPKFYVVGGAGVKDELENRGLDGSGGPEDNEKYILDTHFDDYVTETKQEGFNGVVVGWDTRFNYYKVVKSSLIFQTNQNALFYATNDDPADKLPGGLLVGNGPLLKGLEAACEAVAPDRIKNPPPFGCKAKVMGKPNPLYAKFIADQNGGLDLSKAVMVGDRLDTDIYMSELAKKEHHKEMGSLFVLSGVHDIKKINSTDIKAKEIMPKYILNNIGEIYTTLCPKGSSLKVCKGLDQLD